MKLSEGRRGSIVDLLPMLVLLFIFFITIFIAGLVWHGINEEPMLHEGTAQESIMLKNNIFFEHTLDGLFIFLYFGLSIMVIISAAMARTAPMLFVPLIIVWIIISGSIGIIMQITYSGFIEDPVWTEVLADFPMTMFIMNQIHIISLVIGFLIIISFLVSTKYDLV